MATLNDTLADSDFFQDSIVRPSDRSGFNGSPRVVELQGPFRLFKLTGDRAPQRQTASGPRVSPWWSAVQPFMQDSEGAVGRYKQAYLNGIDMSSMVRYMSAVMIEWNSLSEYVEICIKGGDRVRCFWGPYAPMKLSQDPVARQSDITSYSATGSQASGYAAAVLPMDLGALPCWQFYIPGLNDACIQGGAQRICIDAHDMQALGRHLGLDLGPVSDLRQAGSRLRYFYRDTQMGLSLPRHPVLKEMDRCFDRLWDLDVAPRETLRRFCELGDRYLASQPTDPRPVQEQVRRYVAEARRPL